MEWRPELVAQAGAGAAAALLLFLLLFQPTATVTTTAQEIVPVLRVYYNGELVYTKVRDPPLENWARTLAAILTNQGQTLVDIGGTGYVLNHGDGNDALVGKTCSYASAPPLVVAGSLSADVTPSLYTFDTYYTAQISQANAGWQNGEFVITLKGVIDFTSNDTINAVGLAIQPVIGGKRTILVFADKLSSPISVTASDSMTIIYEIHIKWPQPAS